MTSDPQIVLSKDFADAMTGDGLLARRALLLETRCESTMDGMRCQQQEGHKPNHGASHTTYTVWPR